MTADPYPLASISAGIVTRPSTSPLCDEAQSTGTAVNSPCSHWSAVYEKQLAVVGGAAWLGAVVITRAAAVRATPVSVFMVLPPWTSK